MKWLVVPLILFAVVQASAQRSIDVRGQIFDKDLGTELRFVTIRALGTKAATISERNGEFVIHLDSSAVRLAKAYAYDLNIVVSLIGHQTDTLRLPFADTVINIQMIEKPFSARTVFVSSEDPAVGIMRQVLARKARQTDSIDRYTYMLYTKLVAITDTNTARRSTGHGDSTTFSILESYSRGYAALPSRSYNEIIQRRQTANIPGTANRVAFGTLLNIYNDYLDLVGESIETPFHPDAIDDYEFVLKTEQTHRIVEIEVTPKSDEFKAFVGRIFVDQVDSIPLEVQLTNNSAVNLPFDASLRVRQTFVETDGYLVPEALSMKLDAQVSFLWIFDPRIDIEIQNFLYDFDFTGDFSDDVFDNRRVEVLEGASTYDSTFWRINQKIPLREDEQFAYEEIEQFQESADSLENRFVNNYLGPIADAIVTLSRQPFTTLNDVFRYNTVHGPYLGVGFQFRLDTSIEIRSTAGYGFENSKPYGSLGATYFIDKMQRFSIDGNVYSVLKRRDNPFLVRQSLITFTSVLFGTDYGDYYNTDGWEAGASYTWGQMRFVRPGMWGRANMIRAFYRSERQRSVQNSNTWSLFSRSGDVRPNPSIMDGGMDVIGTEIFIQYRPERRVSRTGMYLYAEHSNPSFMNTDFSFSRVDWDGFLRTRTFPLFTLDLNMSIGWSWGDVPPQKFFSLESSVSGIAVGSAFRVMDVKEFYGNRYATFSLSHNWGEVIPGLLRIPNIAAFGIELITFGSVGWSQFSPQTLDYTGTELPSTDVTRERTYYELGLGINRVLLFLRFDVNARFSQRSRPDWRITVSGATF